jgi:hypothetical protein
MRVHLVTDPECGHLVAAGFPELVTRTAEVSDLAGYPTRTAVLDADADHPLPITDWECPRCLRRLDDSLRIVFRRKVILACEALGVDAAPGVCAYDRLEEERPELMHSERAALAIAAVARLSASGELRPASTPDFTPAMFRFSGDGPR